MNLLHRIFRQLFSTAPAHKTGQPIDGYEIKWEKKLMIPRLKQSSNRFWRSQTKKIKKLTKKSIQESENRFRLITDPKKGKVTDCGYDTMVCVYTKLPAEYDFVFDVELYAERFLSGPAPVGQEAFGIFIRDTMDPEPETGLYYSNMTAVGGYDGRWNIFGRSGITPSNFGHITNYLYYPKVQWPDETLADDPLQYQIKPDAPQQFRLRLIRKSGEITASMEDASGADLLDPEHIRGTEEKAGEGNIIRTPEGYKFTCPDNMFRSINKKHLFLGFFAADGTEISVPKDSIRLTILQKNRPPKEIQAERAAFFPKDEFSRPLSVQKDQDADGRIWYASPGGNPQNSGSKDAPLDIISAIKRCRNGESVCLLPGVYYPTGDITVSSDHSDNNRLRRHLFCEKTTDRSAILDFGGTAHALRITGDFWDVSNLRVTNGFGIIIEGSYNRIRDCSAYRNLETGILIRHHLNDSPRSVWPSNNLVEDCFSWENRDPSEYHADGFACKVAAGEGNCFRRCVSWLNTDDGFDLFSKNRKTGSVLIENCESCLNGYKRDENGNPVKTTGNGNGFKLGGSGLFITHQAVDCISVGNKGDGFTNNSNPYMHLERCRAQNNGKTPFRYFVYEGSKSPAIREIIGCTDNNIENFQMKEVLRELDLRGEGKAE